MRDVFSEHIDREIERAKAGEKAWMILKMNSLIDPGMMTKLYKAAKAGVKIELIVRGIFGLQLDKKKFRENITAISIVDKYLEHSRIFLFGNGGDEKMYISSADWMPRNLNRRIEVACPVYNEEIREELKEMLKIQLRDNTKARILDPELQNNYIKHKHHIVMKIYHNPRCAKSRAGLKYLEEKGYDLEIVKYLNDGLSEKELKEVIAKTGKKPVEFVRTQEKVYKENYKDKELSDDEWIKVLVENPKLLQRPIVVNGEKAVLANPPEKVEEII
jgi:polyphosphate kinase